MSMMQRAYTGELDLNHAQTTACKQHAGAARWAYNWGVQRKQAEYRTTGTSPTALELQRELNALKQTEVPWMYAVSKCAPQEALRNLDRAFDRFFDRVKHKTAGKHHGKLGYPKRKSKKRGLGSFRLTGSIVVVPDAVQLPRLGRLRLTERGYRRTCSVKVRSATVSEQAGHWSVSVLVAHEHQEHHAPDNTGPTVGVDLGGKRLATLSDGHIQENPRHLKRNLKKIKRLQRSVSRKDKGSHNRLLAVERLAKQHRRVAHLRANTLHHLKLTSRLAKTKSVVVLEDLNVSGLLKNHHLAQAISDVGFAEFRRQLLYKARWYGCRVLVAERWYASSKTCSGCRWVDEDLTLADRTVVCRTPDRSDCGLVLDRDLNAAKNVEQLADSSADSQNACGEGSAGLGHMAQVKLPSLKQEPDIRRGLSTFGEVLEDGIACLVTLVIVVMAGRGLVCEGPPSLTPIPPDVEAALAARADQDTVAIRVLALLTIFAWVAIPVLALLAVVGWPHRPSTSRDSGAGQPSERGLGT
jgi:putative transposase